MIVLNIVVSLKMFECFATIIQLLKQCLIDLIPFMTILYLLLLGFNYITWIITMASPQNKKKEDGLYTFKTFVSELAVNY